MFEMMRALDHWLQEKDINPVLVEVVLSAPYPASERIGGELARIADDLSMRPAERLVPITEGQIYGIKFRIETKC